jgi:hypothetical protein
MSLDTLALAMCAADHAAVAKTPNRILTTRPRADLATLMAEFDEGKIKRDERGKFSESGGGSSSKSESHEDRKARHTSEHSEMHQKHSDQHHALSEKHEAARNSAKTPEAIHDAEKKHKAAIKKQSERHGQERERMADRHFREHHEAQQEDKTKPAPKAAERDEEPQSSAFDKVQRGVHVAKTAFNIAEDILHIFKIFHGKARDQDLRGAKLACLMYAADQKHKRLHRRRAIA